MDTAVRWNGNEPARLRVYDLALRLSDQITEALRRARCTPSLADQTRRAVESVVLNTAEGAAHRSAGQKSRHYQIARGSAGECLACLDILRRTNPAVNFEPARQSAQLVSRMLASLIRQWEQRK